MSEVLNNLDLREKYKNIAQMRAEYFHKQVIIEKYIENLV